MTRRLVDLTRGVLALAATIALLTAVPYALYRIGGSPGSDIVRALTDNLTSDNTRTELLLRGGLVLIAWLFWAQLAYALVIETVAALRGGVARTAPLLPGIQAFAARLVASTTLVITSLTSQVPAVAAPLTPSSAIAYEFSTPSIVNGNRHTSALLTMPTPIAVSGRPTYVVQGRDTFWNLADRFLGDGLRWREIRDANLGRTMPDGAVIGDTTEALHTGWDLALPPDAVLPLSTVEPLDAPDRSDLVEAIVDVDPGDHFWSLAKDALTDAWGRPPSDHELAPFWSDMVDLNRERLLPPREPNLIYPGQHFVLPAIPDDPRALVAPVEPVTVEPAPTPPVDPPAPPSTTITPPTTTPLPPTTVLAAPAVPRTSTTVTTTATPAAPPTTTPTSQGQNEGADQDDGVDLRTIVLGIGGLATGAGALALTLRRLRAHQAARRRPGTTVETPPADASAYETRIRPIAETEAVRWLAAANQYLSHRLAQDPEHPRPAVIAARVGRFGVELLLDEACPPVDGFIDAGADATAWRLHPDLELATIEADAYDAHPYSPALVPVGSTEAGDLHLDLEQLGIIALEGEPDAIASWLRTIAADIATVPWAQNCEIIAIGLGDELRALNQVTVPADPAAWTERFTLEMRRLNDRLDATPYEQRINPGELFHPTIVLIGSGHDTIAKDLADIAALINTPAAVIAAATLPFGSRIHLTATTATFEPTGLTFAPALTSSDELDHVAELLTNATDLTTVPDPIPEPEAAESVDNSAESPSGEVTHPPDAQPIEAGCEQEPVDELIERITRKRPIEVQLLTARPRIRGLGLQPQAKQEAVVEYLAYHRNISSQTLRETFWPTATNRSTADNALSQIRQLLGVQDDGTHRLTTAINSSRYQLSDEIGCDWSRASTLIDAAKRRPASEAMALLTAALDLVEGRVGADAPDRHYAWLRDDHEVYGRIEKILIDAAHHLGELALEAGDHERARWAARQGLIVVPCQESLYRLQMRASAAAGDSQGIIDAYRRATCAAESITPWTELQPETEELRQELLGRSHASRGRGLNSQSA